MTQSLSIAAQAATSDSISAALRQVQTRVETGMSVSESLRMHDLCDEVSRRLLFSAERNGQFDQASDTVARIYRAPI